jgi:hypothetical protein
VECPVCVFGDVTIGASADDGISSLAVDGSAYVGYRFTSNVELRIFGSVTHLTDAPYVHIPVNPTDPLRIDEDDLTSATVGAQFKIELGSRLKSLATTSVGF